MHTIDRASGSVTSARRPKRNSAPHAPTFSVELPRPVPRRRDNPWLRRALVLATCVLLVDALFGARGLAESLRTRHDYAQSASQLAALRQENAALREQARRLKSDASAIEAVAREELGLIRPGEILVVVKDLGADSLPAPARP